MAPRSQALLRRLSRLSARQHDHSPLIRILRASGLLVFVFVTGTVGYFWLGEGRYDLLTCAYMTAITLSSIGYGEVIPITGHPKMMVFTIILVLVGMGLMLYFVSALTAFIVDGELRDLLYRRRMKRKLTKLHDHIIIAGLGSVGPYILREVLASARDVVVIEHDEERVQEVFALLNQEVPFLIGDATEDAMLAEARLEVASGVIFSLGNDRDNLFATITARRLNPQVRIITRGDNPSTIQKFKVAGADEVIYTNALGGLRMAAEVLRPQVTTFLEVMMHDHDHYRRIEELPIPTSSPLDGKTLREANLRQHTDALIVAVYDADEDSYVYNPGPDYRLKVGSKLILLMLLDDRPVIEALLSGDTLPVKRR